MRTERLVILLLLSLAVLLPMILLPFIGAGVVATVDEMVADDQESLRDGPPVRLLSGPMLGPGGRQGGAVYLSVQLPSLTAARRLCEMQPVFLDGFHVYAEEHPRRMDPARTGAARDPSLTKALQALVPKIPIDAARLMELHVYLKYSQTENSYTCARRIPRSTLATSYR